MKASVKPSVVIDVWGGNGVKDSLSATNAFLGLNKIPDHYRYAEAIKRA